MSKVRHIVAGVIKQEDYVLLVQQKGPEDVVPNWSLPGGVTRPGEPLELALKREIREETGLSVRKMGDILYVARLLDRAEGTDTKTYVFAIDEWNGVLRPNDPDNLIITAEFMPPNEAIEKLNELPWPVMRDPIVSYLKGEFEKGYVWLFHRLNGEDKLLTRLPSSSL